MDMIVAWTIMIIGLLLLSWALFQLVTLNKKIQQRNISTNVSELQNNIVWHVYYALIACMMIAVSGILLVTVEN